MTNVDTVPPLNFLYYNACVICFKLEQKINSNALMKKECEKIVRRLKDKRNLVICHLWEGTATVTWKKHFETLVAELKNNLPDLKIIQIANSWYRDQDSKLTTADAIYYLDFFLMRVFHNIMIQKVCDPAVTWDSKAEKFLFLTGKPFKFNRVRLLYKLVNAGLVGHAVWSFNCRTLQEIQKSSVYIEEMTNQEFADFVKTYTNFPDKYFSSTGTPFETRLYESKLFKLVSETEFNRNSSCPWITEKTWLAIVNRLPFIMAGEHKTLQRLNQMGFKTFQDYLTIPNYDNPDDVGYLQYTTQEFLQTHKDKQQWNEFYQEFKGPDWPEALEFSQINTLPQNWQDEIAQSYQPGVQSDSELRADAIVQNVEFWLDNIAQYEKQICTDIETNYNRFIELGEKNLLAVHNIKELHGLEGNLLEKIFQKDFE
jgi:hypothetical protein